MAGPPNRGGNGAGSGSGRRPPLGPPKAPGTVAPVVPQYSPSERLRQEPIGPLLDNGGGHPSLFKKTPGQAPGAGAQAPAAPPSPLGGSGVIPVRLWQQFVGMLPPEGFINWRRTVTVAGTEVSGITLGTDYVKDIEVVPTRTTRLIFACEFFWLDQGLDPLDVDALAAFQDYQNAYGRWPANIRANSVPLLDVKESVFDPTGGGTTRIVGGVTRLNQNILDEGGGHPTVFYVKEAQTLSVAWTNVALPGHVPSAVGVELRGYSIPQSVFDEVLTQVRRG